MISNFTDGGPDSSSIRPLSGRLFTVDGPNTNMSKDEIEEYLQTLSEEIYKHFILDTIILIFMAIIGTTSNSIVIYIYNTKFMPSSTRSAILAMTVFDLVASCINMPGEILTIRYFYNFPSSFLCKCIRTLDIVVIFGASFSLLLVTYDRYHRICFPLLEQLTVVQAEKILLISYFVTFLLCIPSFIVSGIDGVDQHHRVCFIDKNHEHKALLVFNYVLHVILVVTIAISVISLYVLIGRTVLRQNKQMQVVRQMRRREVVGYSSSVDGPQEDVGTHRKPQRGTVQPSCTTLAGTNTASSTFQQIKPSSRNKRGSVSAAVLRRTTRKTIHRLCIITVVFLLSFLPYNVMIGFILTKEVRDIKRTDGILSQFSIRSFFIKSVTDSLLYVYCSPKFRKETKSVMVKHFFSMRRNFTRRLTQ